MVRRHLVVVLLAWVLWIEARPSWIPSHVRWFPEGGSDTAEECRSQAEEQLVRWLERHRDRVVGIKPTGLAIKAEGEPDDHVLYFTFRCLPDTIDPRAPKR